MWAVARCDFAYLRGRIACNRRPFVSTTLMMRTVLVLALTVVGCGAETFERAFWVWHRAQPLTTEEKDALAKQLDAGHLLTYVGDGHTAYRRGSTCIDRKVDAIFCHESQLVDTGEWFREWLRERANDVGKVVGVPFAESFRRLDL